jgi:hypothetical protein
MKKEIIDLGWLIESVRDLKWVNAEKTRLDCIVKFDAHVEELPFTIDPNDFYQHSIDLWEKANAGEYGVIPDYVPKPKNDFEKVMENYKNQFGGDFSLDKI